MPWTIASTFRNLTRAGSYAALHVCAILLIASLASILAHVPQAPAQQAILAPKGTMGSTVLGYGFGRGLSTATGALEGIGRNGTAFSNDIGEARRRYWASFPDGEDHNAAESAFAELLFQKDLFFLSINMLEGPFSGKARMLNAFGKQFDGGIADGPRPAFYKWVLAVRDHLGANQHDDDVVFGNRRLPDMLFVGGQDMLSVLAAIAGSPLPPATGTFRVGGRRIVSVSSAKFIEALLDENVQKLYRIYEHARNRHEFSSVGRLDEFEAANTAAREAIVVGQPNDVSTRNDEKLFEYGIVPEDFVPQIVHEPGNGIYLVSYLMDKANVGSLVKVNLAPFGPLDLHVRYDRSSRDYETYMRDANAARNAKAVLLECYYLTDRPGYPHRNVFWYRKAPEGAEPSQLMSRLSDHPMLQIGAAAESCPAR